MKGSALLVLLFCLSRAQGAIAGVNESVLGRKEIETTEMTPEQTDTQTSATRDIWTELRQLRDMVVEQKVELRNMEARLKDSEKLLGEQRIELIITRNKVEELEKEKTAQATELTSVAARLTVSEKEVEDQKKEVVVLTEELSATKTELQLQSSKVAVIERENADRPMVAFSAGLTDSGDVGPFNSETPLIYSRVHTNTGTAYNKYTGVFTAPVRGLYYFRFTAFDHRISSCTGVNLYLNDRRVLYNYECNDDGGHISVSNAVILELSEGDVVYLRLPKAFGMYDSLVNESTFSGHLLFPV